MKAHNPAPNYYEMLAQLATESEDIIAKAMSGKVGDYSSLPAAHDINPWDSKSAYGGALHSSEHEGTAGLDYGVLLQMSRVPVISAIIQTRINQVAEFCTPQESPFDAGFVIGPRNKDADITDDMKRRIVRLTEWIETCGEGYKHGGAYDFESFVRMILRDSLTYDQCTFELMRNRKGELVGFVPVDASTIRRAAVGEKEREEGRRSWTESAFVQVINQQEVADWDADALAFAIRRPRTWIYSRGYGYPELEELIRTVTYLVNAETYNASNFMNGIHVNSILAVKSKMSPQLFRAFRRDFYAMLSGANQAKRTPILQLDPESNEEVSSVNMSSSAEEMGYSTWMGYLTKIACAIYQIDPAELGFVFGSEGVTSTVFGAAPEQRIIASRDRGLRPLLRQVQGWINRWIIHEIDPHLSLRFMGLDSEGSDAKLKSDMEKVQHYMTINEIRGLNGLAPLEKGGDIILNQTYITGMTLDDMGDEDADFEEGEGAEIEEAGDEGDEGAEPVEGAEATEQQEGAEPVEGDEATEQQEDSANRFEDAFKARRVHVSVEI
jgi:hypothetical protein